ncbi:ribonucleoside triphosphate reductase [TM7 phylum sp. oral taxon 352]|nr:ribonucleoside triphosphate reductase [TM7 phylum sp. oral taxon 352]TWP15359.1 ribonucleoside triphosphate reductase [TM7 phylum sp. oral taxon 352]TWP17248.1 ribonucleoside triphosphate reductase [TM7 phylum sp. oral taxon 352]TWP17373.1 ribonucleoside triphosphate reductase [TM7 phylum sp. oral taxon 352]TWP17937.1 ribonucleoside triphosphate reductase [TM7 phylum sp. oral taxon 352]
MYKSIKKRDGRTAKFDRKKIEKAIKKAGLETGEFDAAQAVELTDKVLGVLETRNQKRLPSVEDIQDIVEDALIDSKFKKTAKAYIIYRDQHKKLREITSNAHVDLIDKYLENLDWKVNENSNMGYSLQGLNNYVSAEITKTYWLDKIYTSKIGQAHKEGDLHIHDLNLLSVYCVGWDLTDLLQEGFTGVAGKVASKPAKHFRSALGQVVNFFYTLQGEAAGAQAFSDFDTLLAPFIRADKLSYEEVKQAIQEFVFNVNVPTRVGFQTPFTNITLDLECPKHMADNPVIIGGEMQDTTYGEYQEEMNMLNKALLEVLSEGDANGRVFTFPIPTVNITKDFNWDNPVIESLWEASAKYGIPYFSNFINSDMDPEDARSMCCRLRIDNRQLEYRGGGLFGSNPMTGSVGVVTINLPRLALKSKNEKEFFKGLAELMDMAKDSLETKRKVLERLTDANLYPYTKFYLRNIKQRFNQYWKNHFSTIGLIGTNEAALNLLGVDIGTEKGKAFAEKTLDFMRDRLVEYQKETGNNYNLEATPAEGTTYRLAQLDKASFPDRAHFANGIGAEVKCPFYTNSSHLPVNYTDDLFELMDLQDNLQTKYTGGTVIHFFLGERMDDPQTLKKLVKTICENYKLPYFTFSPSFSICKNHGYIVGEHPECPKCGEATEVYSRVVGFLRPVSQWNKGKQAEFEMREHYDNAAEHQRLSAVAAA